MEPRDDRSSTAEPALPPVPTGLEHLLHLAASHPGFADALVARRDAAADAAGVLLTAGERAMVRAVPGPALRQMIGRVSVPGPDRRGFLEHAALAVAALVSGTVLAACDRSERPTRERDDERTTSMGIEPGIEDMRPDRPDAGPDAGPRDAAAPDAAPPRPTPVPAGIRPHPRPPTMNVSDGIRP